MSDTPALERLLRRDRAITVAGLAILCLLAWAYLLAGAGMGMSTWEMTRLTLFPHLAAHAPAMPGMGDMAGMAGMPGMEGMAPPSPTWTAGFWALVVAMWWTMMAAMMAPSAAPAILLYGRVHRHAPGGQAAQIAPSWAFALGYLATWLVFAVAAAAIQWGLQRAGLVGAHSLASGDRWLSAGVLAAAGLYQLSPWQAACLTHCRSPAQFLSQYWRPGLSGALRLGVLHGAYCVGCCWLLMALLFVGGVMNLAWIAALSLLVLAQKVAPGGPWIGRGAGVLLLAWAAATVLI